MTAFCGDKVCPSAALTKDVDDLRVTFTLGKVMTYTLPFDMGVPGVPLRTGGTVQSGVEWYLLVDFGLSRETGPYIVAHDTPVLGGLHPETKAELGVKANVGFGDAEDDTRRECEKIDPFNGDDRAPFDVGYDPHNPTIGATYSYSRCITAVLGFLQVALRDGDGKDKEDIRSSLALSATLNLHSKSEQEGLGRIGYQELVAGNAGLSSGLVLTRG